MAREIRLITPEYIEDYLTIYLNAYPAYKNTGEEGRDKYRPRILHSMENDKNIHFYGLFEDGKLIAQMKVLDFTMNAFGRMVKATGLMALGVHPLHKKKGLAREMVQFFENYTKESGATVALLLPFRMDFYRQLGYGCGTKMDEYHIPTLQLPKGDTSRLKYMGIGDVDKVLACYSSFVQKNHGYLMKFEEEIRDMRGDDEVRR
ncbi:MAG: GNAT family N-acetyltransferase, partial [Firmicutes bacterium]|nr:GNAT family N-acetyltransferase [Bacillota bacterium]